MTWFIRSMLNEIASKNGQKEKKWINDKGKGSKTLNDIKPVENINKNS